MVNHFSSNIIRFDTFNKLNYTHSHAVLKYIKLKITLYPTNLYDILNSFIFTKIFSNSHTRLQLNLNEKLSIKLAVNNIKKRAFHSLFLLLAFKDLLFINKLFIYFYFYQCKSQLLYLRNLQKASILFSKLLVISVNVSRSELDFINNNNQLN
jgi:hypothetical protein